MYGSRRCLNRAEELATSKLVRPSKCVRCLVEMRTVPGSWFQPDRQINLQWPVVVSQA
jgi:hypothetical protein